MTTSLKEQLDKISTIESVQEKAQALYDWSLEWSDSEIDNIVDNTLASFSFVSDIIYEYGTRFNLQYMKNMLDNISDLTATWYYDNQTDSDTRFCDLTKEHLDKCIEELYECINQ